VIVSGRAGSLVLSGSLGVQTIRSVSQSGPQPECEELALHVVGGLSYLVRGGAGSRAW